VTGTLAVMPGEVSPVSTVATRSWTAIGTTVSVAVATTDAELVDAAQDLLVEDLRAIDVACSRFRPDSEICDVERRPGRPVPVSPLLFEALQTACRVAVQTAGTVDPTVGLALVELGYDRDFSQMAGGAERQEGEPQPAPGWWHIALDATGRTVTLPEGVRVDLGSTAKALAADRSAARLSALLGCGILVNLGGDVAVSGSPPDEGWAVGIATSCTTAPDRVDQVVAVSTGGLATSGTTARAWTRNGRRVHHIVDPWTGAPARSPWALVTTVADSCVDANAWSTAAVVWAEDAVGNLEANGVAARLVTHDGTIVHIGGWPDESQGLDGPNGPQEGAR